MLVNEVREGADAGLAERRNGNARPAALLNGCSIEITARESASLKAAAALLEPGTQVNLAFLGTETDEQRIQAAVQIRRLGLEPMPHLSARRISSPSAAQAYLAALRAQAEVTRVLVVGGDLPAPGGPYADALALIRGGLLAAHGIGTVAIAGYPEGHPDIADPVLWRSLRDKQAALREQGMAVEIMTQFCFDAGRILAWLERLREEGIDAPARIGVAGPASAATLLRYAARCGVAVSAGMLRKYGVSITRLIGSAGPMALLETLGRQLDPVRHGEVSLHVYPFGGIEATLRWLSRSRQ